MSCYSSEDRQQLHTSGSPLPAPSSWGSRSTLCAPISSDRNNLAVPALFPDELRSTGPNNRSPSVWLSSGRALGLASSSFNLLLIEASEVPVLLVPYPGMRNARCRADPCCISTFLKLAYFCFPAQAPVFKTKFFQSEILPVQEV